MNHPMERKRMHLEKENQFKDPQKFRVSEKTGAKNELKGKEEKKGVDPGSDAQMKTKMKTQTMDSDPTAVNAKFPPFRRAALHFLTTLLKACIRRTYADFEHRGGFNDVNQSPGLRFGLPGSGSGQDTERQILGIGLGFPTQLIRRTKTVLGYVATTDEDDIVRVMARECVEAMEEMARAVLVPWEVD